jgi:stress response protein YsnF
MATLVAVPVRIEKVLVERDASTSDQTQTIVNLGRIQAELRALVELTRIQTELLLYIAQRTR